MRSKLDINSCVKSLDFDGENILEPYFLKSVCGFRKLLPETIFKN